MDRNSARAASDRTPAAPENPLDTSFTPRGPTLRGLAGGYLEFDDSLYKNLTLTTIGRLAQVAERHPNALKYFPEGSRLVLSAEGDRGSAWEDSYLGVYCQLKYPGSNGNMKISQREHLSFNSTNGIPAAFERYLRELEGPCA